MPEKRLQKRRTCGIMGANPQKKGCALHEMSALPQPRCAGGAGSRTSGYAPQLGMVAADWLVDMAVQAAVSAGDLVAGGGAEGKAPAALARRDGDKERRGLPALRTPLAGVVKKVNQRGALESGAPLLSTVKAACTNQSVARSAACFPTRKVHGAQTAIFGKTC